MPSFIDDEEDKCDDCEKVDPFEVEYDITAYLDENEETILQYDDRDLEYFLTNILNRLNAKFGENKIEVRKIISGKEQEDETLILYFKRDLRIKIELGTYSVTIYEAGGRVDKYGRRDKHLGYMSFYKAADFIMDYVENSDQYLTEEEKIVKDVIT